MYEKEDLKEMHIDELFEELGSLDAELQVEKQKGEETEAQETRKMIKQIKEEISKKEEKRRSVKNERQ